MFDKQDAKRAVEDLARERQEHPSKPQEPLEALVESLSFIFFGLIIWGSFKYGPPLIQFIGSSIAGVWLRLIYMTMILCTAVGLYFFRKEMKWLYGISECAFGSVLAWTSLNDFNGSLPTNFIPLVAAAYFIVRGLVNWREGLGER